MKTSARNVFHGKVVAVRSGAVNDEVELSVEGGQTIVASITQASTEKLGLKPGVEAMALIKASFVLLMNDAEDYLLSIRNQFNGTVAKVTPGAVNAEVLVDLPGGAGITSIVTMGSVDKLQLAPGKKVTAIVKAMHVILAVSKYGAGQRFFRLRGRVARRRAPLSLVRSGGMLGACHFIRKEKQYEHSGMHQNTTQHTHIYGQAY